VVPGGAVGDVARPVRAHPREAIEPAGDLSILCDPLGEHGPRQ
jgi:hypothetical protein